MLPISERIGPPLGRSDVVIALTAGSDTAVALDTLSEALATAGHARAVAFHGSRDALASLERRLGPLRGPDVWSAPDGASAEGLDIIASAVAPADIVLLRAGCRLPPGWLEELAAAARSDLVIATASALDAELIDGRPHPGLVGRGIKAGTPAPGALPRLEAPFGPCVYLRRSAIELAGLPLGPGFAERCRGRGLAHGLVGTVIVAGGVSRVSTAVVGSSGAGDAAAEPVASARLTARLSRGELALVIDARELDGPPNGTRIHLCELIGAVAQTGAADVSVLLPPQMDPDTRRLLDRASGARLVPVDAAGRPPADLRADVVHRPHQVHSPADLTLLAGLAPRLVLTQQDLIEFHAPLYFASEAAWRSYRELTRLALVSADRVLFFSEHARAEALAGAMVEPTRADVVPLGTDHALSDQGVTPLAPGGAHRLEPDSEVILCLGTDMRHKNREFALALAASLRHAHDWHGTLVFAGPHVALGSSASGEASLLASDPDLAALVLELGEVSDAERAWLLARATLVLYPTVQEGFGLLPYEAAAHGVPCLWAPGTALAEMLGDAVDGIVPWDPAAAGERALSLMRDPVARAAHVEAVIVAGRELSWARTGLALVDAYRATCAGPPTPAGVIVRASELMSGAVSPDGIRLVGPDGLLPSDAERPLLAVLSRPRLASPVLGALRQGYRLARRRADAQ